MEGRLSEPASVKEATTENHPFKYLQAKVTKATFFQDMEARHI